MSIVVFVVLFSGYIVFWIFGAVVIAWDGGGVWVRERGRE
jgi:hypothetical protein